MARKSQLYLTAQQIDAAVRKLYSKSGYVVLSEVRNGTGYARSVRTADMLAVSTWPSRGLFCEGIEIKSDRGDLQRELEHPEKADEIARYCLKWWIAVPDGLAESVMLPPTWGVITVDDKLKATIARHATELSPVPMDSLMVCSILRNFAEGYVPKIEIAPLIETARQEERKSAEHARGYRLKELEAGFARFKECTGIDLIERNHPVWNMGEIGDAVRLITELKGKPISEIMRAKDALTAGLSAIDAALGVIDTSPKI